MAEDGVNANEEQRLSSGGAVSSVKVFLGGLSWETTEDTLKSYFAKYGVVDDVVVMRDRMTRVPRGFGFITFKEEASAAAACAETHSIDGRTIDAKPSVPQGDSQKPRSKKIFVGGLAPETTDEQFKAYFKDFGTIVEAQVMVDHNTARSRGFGFVTFEEEEAVQKVLENGQMHELGGKQVEVKNATPKGSGPQMGGRNSGYNGGGGGGGRGPAGGRGYGGRGYDQYAQQGYGMAGAYGYGAQGQYGGQYAYGMQPYGAYTGMMMGYGQFGGYGGGYGGQGQQQQAYGAGAAAQGAYAGHQGYGYGNGNGTQRRAQQ